MAVAISKHKWTFRSRFRAGAYSWKTSGLECQRLREAVTEIKKVAKKNPRIAAEGAVRLIGKIWPALEQVDSSSGALGSAVNKTLDELMPIVVNAPADEKTRDEWLDRINATVGFEELPRALDRSSRSLMRTFGPRGNPRPGNLEAPGYAWYWLTLHRQQRKPA